MAARLLEHLSVGVLLCFSAQVFTKAAQAPKPGNNGQSTPRGLVTDFLESCRDGNYEKAAQDLDLRHLSARSRSLRGPGLAKQLYEILNADSHFNVLSLSRNPEGNLSDDADPSREHIATLTQGGETYTLDLQRVVLQPGASPVWLFSSDTVAAIPKITPSTSSPIIARYLPGFLVSIQILATSLWKWIALILAALFVLSISRLLDRLLELIMRIFRRRRTPTRLEWLDAIIQPARVIVCVAVFKVALEFIGPSAIARLYIGRALFLVVVCAIAWSLIRLVDFFLDRLDTRWDSRQQFASRSIIHLGRRTANVTIIIFAILLILSNWGYNTATLIAGLGVGGIAIALAAQQTIANVFGGVSVIGDHPVRIGDFGKFGDLIGTVEDIGMRSTRIRTLNRTVVSVPNSSFAGLNIENYSVRDKMLFNPTLQVKRSTPDEKVRQFVDALHQMLSQNKALEVDPTAVRLKGLASDSFSIEIFCYVLTTDTMEFNKMQGDLFLAINQVVNNSGIELG